MNTLFDKKYVDSLDGDQLEALLLTLKADYKRVSHRLNILRDGERALREAILQAELDQDRRIDENGGRGYWIGDDYDDY